MSGSYTRNGDASLSLNFTGLVRFLGDLTKIPKSLLSQCFQKMTEYCTRKKIIDFLTFFVYNFYGVFVEKRSN